MYLGLRTPLGAIPKGVKGNAVQREDDCANDMTYQSYFWRLCDMASSVFEWRNLPQGINERMIEHFLLFNGMALFVYDEGIREDPLQRSPEGYAVMQMTYNGQFDIYNIPEKRMAYSMNPEHTALYFDSTNSVICFNDNMCWPTVATIELYAKRLWRLERSIDVNVEQQKTPRIVKCSEKQRLTMQNLFAQIDGFMPTVWADKDLDLTGVEVLDTASPFVAKDLQVVKHQIWNEALTFIGVENTNTDKKERMVSDEVLSNMGDVEAQRFTRLNCRKQFCEEVNNLFGLDIECDFRSGLYIRTDKDGIVPSEGMDSGSFGGGGNTGYGDDLLGKLRRLVGA